VLAVCVTVMPATPIWASSDEFGTWWSDELAEFTQLLATSQSPPVPIFQSIEANKVRSSIASQRGRNARRLQRFAPHRPLRERRAPDDTVFRLYFMRVVISEILGHAQPEGRSVISINERLSSASRRFAPHEWLRKARLHQSVSGSIGISFDASLVGPDEEEWTQRSQLIGAESSRYLPAILTEHLKVQSTSLSGGLR